MAVKFRILAVFTTFSQKPANAHFEAQDLETGNSPLQSMYLQAGSQPQNGLKFCIFAPLVTESRSRNLLLQNTGQQRALDFMILCCIY